MDTNTHTHTDLPTKAVCCQIAACQRAMHNGKDDRACDAFLGDKHYLTHLNRLLLSISILIVCVVRDSGEIAIHQSGHANDVCVCLSVSIA